MSSFIKNQKNSLILRVVLLLSFLVISNASYAQSISVETLSKPNLDNLGLLDGGAGGIPQNSWNDTSYEQILFLLDKQPINSHSPVVQELLRRVLLSKTSFPISRTGKNDYFLKRLELLIKLGEYQSVRNLTSMVPASEFNEDYAKIESDVDLMSKDYEHLCKKNQLNIELYGSDYWQKVRLFCLATENKKEELELGLNLLLEQEAMNTELSCCTISFEDLLNNIIEKGSVKDLVSSFFDSGSYADNLFKETEDGSITISPLDFALLEAANAPFPEKIVNKATPGLLRSISLYSNSPLWLRIYAAELGLGAGSVNIAELEGLYKKHIWQGSLDVELQNKLYPLRRAAIFQTLAATEMPTRSLLETLQKTYKDSNLQHVANFITAQTFIKLSQNIYNRPELLDIADIAITSLLASGHLDEANIWYRMVELFEKKDKRAAKVANIVRPLTRGTIPIGPSWKGEYANDWWNKNNEKNYLIAGRLFSAIYAFRHHIPSELWEIVLRNSDMDKLSEYPSAAIIGNLKSSAQKKKAGETILLSLIYMGEQMPHELHDNIIADVIQALLKIGMKKQAQSLAVESIVNHPDY
jgi:hypothetical protein